jgi:hypothetical protein
LSIFIFFYFYVFIYFFSFFFFLFQKDSSFFNMFYNEKKFLKNCIFVWLDAGPPVFPKDFFNRNGTSRGPHSGCPGRPTLFVTSSTGNGQWLEKSSRHCPIFVHTDRRTPVGAPRSARRLG